MKKISLKNLNLKEVEQLSREQLKNVFGGQVETTDVADSGTCCVSVYYPNGDSNKVCGVSKASAQAAADLWASDGRAYWCCDSC